MRQLVMELVTFARRRRVSALALLVPLTLSAAPASAQDVFGFLRLFSSPIAREPVYQPYELRALPELERRTIRRRPKVVRADPPKIPIKPKAPGEVTNPVPELLADSTLRRGDIVMFPEGPKVFNGQPGTQHALTDFVPVFELEASCLTTSQGPGKSSSRLERCVEHGEIHGGRQARREHQRYRDNWRRAPEALLKAQLC